MNVLVDFVTNYLIVCAGASWLMAQILKTFTGVFKLKKFSWTEFFFGTGGMPSSHTAAVCALTAASAIKYSFGSGYFAISAVLALVVMKDAMGMRREVGEHSRTLNLILADLSNDKKDSKLTQKAFDELAGHTPLQVFAGMLVGILMPIIIAFIPAFGVSIAI